MSVLASHLRALLISNLRNDMNPKIKQAALNLFNAVDEDLDVMGHSLEGGTVSSTTEEAIEALDKTLSSFSLDADDEDRPEIDIIPVILVERDDENSTKLKGGE